MSENEAKYEFILTSSLKLFSENGIRSISMDDLCRNMGISKKTLYKYVDNKADLIQKISNFIYDEIKNKIEELKDSDLNAIDFLLEMSKLQSNMMANVNPIVNFELRKYYSLIFENNRLRRKKLIINSILMNLKQGIKEGLYRLDLDMEIIAHLYYKKIEDFHSLEVDNLQSCSFEKVFEVMFENHIRGIANKNGIAYFEKQKEKLNFNIQ
jgi:AcrR family transcriptional regulator